MPTTPARGAGVAYRRAEQAEPHGGGGQGLLAFGAVLLAGLVFAVGAFALLTQAPAASRTPFTGAVVPTSSLPIFVQDTPTPAPLPSFTPLPSYALFTQTPPFSIVPPSFASSPPFSVPPATPTPPTATPTAVPTPINCASSDGSNMRSEVIGYGNEQSFGPIPRAWCIHQIIIRPYLQGEELAQNPPIDPSTVGKPGVTRLLENGERLMSDTCAADECNDKTRTFSPPHLTPDGSTLTYEFTCIDNAGTPEDECLIPGGATIEIRYEVVRGT